MKLSAIVLAVLPAAALAQAPGDPDFYSTVAELYNGPDCAADKLIFADPIFGTGGICQPLDRNNNVPEIISYKVTTQYPGCSATLYTDDGCMSTPYPAPLGQCVQADKPFVMAFVECPFS